MSYERDDSDYDNIDKDATDFDELESQIQDDLNDWYNLEELENQDFSYFGDPDIFTEEYLAALCDDCRCHSH